MNLSISNIGWPKELDDKVYKLMEENGFSGLEIAPTRVFSEEPYEDLSVVRDWGNKLLIEHGFRVPSMQSIWYGRSEKLFGSEEDRTLLLEYTKKAVCFAESLGCSNLVFGCPKNRSVPDGGDTGAALSFFRQIGEYAINRNCVIAIEANPPIYNTNFLNTTGEALDYIKMVDSKGVLLNLDVGTMIANGEDIEVLRGNEQYIHHVHISEPGLKAIEKRDLHLELSALLRASDYDGYVSIEVSRQDDAQQISSMLEYVRSLFG